MKIGILTWYYAFNYGARAHSYALYKVIQELGHDCVMIAYHPTYAIKSNIDSSMGFTNRKKHPILVLRSLNRCRKFIEDEKRFHKTHVVRNAEEIDNLRLDVIILGSDEVFNINHPCFSDLYYGVGIKTPLISYAPSAGQVPARLKLKYPIIESLNRMVSISVRDENTKELIKYNVDRKVELVSDPTLLYEFKDVTKGFPIKNYLLIYSFETYDNFQVQIKSYAKAHNLKIISLLNRIEWADYSMDMIDFDSWIVAFRYADVIVTDSFHGIVFSIKNKKNFVVIKRGDKVNKIDSLFSQLSIGKSYYSGESIEEYLKKEIDYIDVYKHLLSLKTSSLDFLKQSLMKIESE